MKTASRAQPRSSPPLVQMRRYTPGVYPFLFPSIISSLPQLPPPSPQRLQIQQPSSSGSTPSPVGEYCCCTSTDTGCRSKSQRHIHTFGTRKITGMVICSLYVGSNNLCFCSVSKQEGSAVCILSPVSSQCRFLLTMKTMVSLTFTSAIIA